jgi:hypothetical protein
LLGEMVNGRNKPMAKKDGGLPARGLDPRRHSCKPREPERVIAQGQLGSVPNGWIVPAI